MIEVLVVIGLASLLSLVFANTINNIHKEQRGIDEKFEVSSLKNIIASVLSSNATCIAQLRNGAPPMDLTDATTTTVSATAINYTELRAGPLATSPLIVRVGDSLPGRTAGQMVVSSIQFLNINSTGNLNEFKGQLVVSIDPRTTVRGLKPLTFDQVFTVNPPLNAATFLACGFGATPCTTVNSGAWAATGTATCVTGRLTGSSCDFNRGGDGRVINPLTCQPDTVTNSVSCVENNTGTCKAYAICCP